MKCTVALLMPSLNEASSVDAAMAAIAASSRRPDEILVIDGGSTDGTLERLEFHARAGLPVRTLVRPGKLPGAARNEGALASRSDVLLFLDFGNVIDSRWIEEMAAPFEADSRTEAVGGLYEPLTTNDFEVCVAAVQYQDATVFARLPRHEQEARLPAQIRLGGLGMAVRRDTYLRLGGQPDWLRAGEDFLFGHKLLASGAPTAVALGARLYHHMRPTPGDLFRQNRLYSRGEGRIGVGLAHHAKVAALHTAVLAGLVGGLAQPVLPVAAVALLGAYLYRRGVTRLAKTFGSQALQGRLLKVALAVLVKDAGSLAGYAWGRWERLTQPDWRRQQQRYLGELVVR